MQDYWYKPPCLVLRIEHKHSSCKHSYQLSHISGPYLNCDLTVISSVTLLRIILNGGWRHGSAVPGTPKIADGYPYLQFQVLGLKACATTLSMTFYTCFNACILAACYTEGAVLHGKCDFSTGCCATALLWTVQGSLHREPPPSDPFPQPLSDDVWAAHEKEKVIPVALLSLLFWCSITEAQARLAAAPSVCEAVRSALAGPGQKRSADPLETLQPVVQWTGVLGSMKGPCPNLIQFKGTLCQYHLWWG